MEKIIKWPNSITFIRHDISAYNALKSEKEKDSLFKSFIEAYNKDKYSKQTRKLALAVDKKFALTTSDAETKLADKQGKNAVKTGKGLSADYPVPDVIFVSPYLRTKETLRGLIKGWPALGDVKVYEEERIREQEHGLASLYSDWRVFQTLHPEQYYLYNKEGSYYYRYPQGENVPDVRERNRSWINTLTRDFAGKNILVVTHHLTILALRANLERLDAKGFIDLDEHHKPINSGVTVYKCDPDKGSQGKLVLEVYNKKYW